LKEITMPATKTQTTARAATAQAAPATSPATATTATQRVEKESIALKFSDVHEAFEVLSVLCVHLEGLYEDLNHHGWTSARTANTIAIAAGAIHYHADALTDAMIDRRNAQGGDEGDAHEGWEESLPAAVPPAPVAPRVVTPRSVARLEALRGEFSDDPEGFRFLLDLATISTRSGAPQDTPAQLATPQKPAA